MHIKNKSPDCHRWMSAAVYVRITGSSADNAAVPGPGLSGPSFYAQGAVQWPGLSRIDPAPAAGPVLGPGRAGRGPSVTTESQLSQL